MAARSLAAAVLLATAFLLAPAGALVEPASTLPGLVGAWSPPQTLNTQGTHAALLPTGKVLLWAGHNNAKLWDPATGATQQVNLGGDRTIFCSGHTLLPDGRVLVVSGLGGTGGSSQGHARTHLFDPWTERWTRGPDMAAGRWYPGVVALPDGTALAMGGLDETADLNRRVERLAGGAWDHLEGADRDVGTYPRLFVLPSGEVLKAGPAPVPQFFDPATGAWRSGPAAPGGARGGGGAVLLPGLDEVLVFGGAQAATIKATAEVFDLSANAWRDVGSMAVARKDVNPVLLADGTVLAVGGTPVQNKAPSALAPEVFDPATGAWSLLAPMQRGRTYHSTALLLPDGRVAVMGSDIEGVGVQTEDGFVGLPQTNQRTIEVYSPPYLFQGPRPGIAEAPASVTYGQAFAVASPEAGSIARVALVRPGTATHSVNFDQRYVELAFTAGNGTLAVTAPPSGNHAPPGWYLLVLVDAQGVPSEGKMMRVA